MSRGGWRLLNPSNEEYRLGVARKNGRCECGARTSDVVRFDNGDLSALCTSCRMRHYGLSSEDRKSLRAKQAVLFK